MDKVDKWLRFDAAHRLDSIVGVDGVQDPESLRAQDGTQGGWSFKRVPPGLGQELGLPVGELLQMSALEGDDLVVDSEQSLLDNISTRLRGGVADLEVGLTGQEMILERIKFTMGLLPEQRAALEHVRDELRKCKEKREEAFVVKLSAELLAVAGRRFSLAG